MGKIIATNLSNQKFGALSRALMEMLHKNVPVYKFSKLPKGGASDCVIVKTNKDIDWRFAQKIKNLFPNQEIICLVKKNQPSPFGKEIPTDRDVALFQEQKPESSIILFLKNQLKPG